MSCEPWQCAEIASTKKANPIMKPDVAVAMIKKASRPLLIVGSDATQKFMEGRPLIDFLIDFANASKVPVVATAHMVGEFLKRGYQPAGFMNAFDISNRLADPSWKGLDGRGNYDLVMYVALPYYMEALILAGLKHFTTLKTMTLDNMFHVHASWSFPNSTIEEFASNLKVMTSKFSGGN